MSISVCKKRAGNEITFRFISSSSSRNCVTFQHVYVGHRAATEQHSHFVPRDAVRDLSRTSRRNRMRYVCSLSVCVCVRM